MRSKITKEKILVITTILIVSIVFIGIGYAFFTANNPEGSTAQIISKSGRMLINYDDGTDSIISVTDIQPSNNILVDKTFKLTGINTTASDDLPMPYIISIEYQNTFQKGELEYYIKRMNTNENIGCTLKGVYIINDAIVSEVGLPASQVGYTAGAIDDWSGKPTTQEIAYGEFKPSSEEQELTLNLRMMFRDSGNNQDYNKGATFNGKIVVTAPETSTFSTDTWEEIADNVKSGNASKYRVGSEKEVEINGTSYTVRVANNSTPDECDGTNFSQTACGFVVEFVDIVEERAMNSTRTNKGGWGASEMRKYANGDFFNKLPSDLQNVIIDTKVVSGYGSDDTNNFTTTDKIYLLSTHEIWKDVGTYLSTYDTAYSNTRQLDYYQERETTIYSHFINASKKNIYDVMSSIWWLRSAEFITNYRFWGVDIFGSFYRGPSADSIYSLAPAFRIG